jgi:4-hydroxythreonine-4-phosphate dehydrogenase
MPTLKSQRIKVGLTMGDPSGIGPGIIAKSLAKLKNLAQFVVIGDEWVFEKAVSSQLSADSYKFIDLNNVPHKNFTFGKVKAEYGRASIEYLDQAMGLIRDKEIDCLVTAPISKEAINLAGFTWRGHTEYLTQSAGVENFVMMLLNKRLKIALVTRHTPLKSVALELNENNVSETILLTYKYLKDWFSIEEPRLVVCGLNPHGSDNGLIGNEENEIIKPVIRRLSKKIRYIAGPLPCDVALAEALEGKYDCAIAMYHDQALIPLKITDAQSGVNITLGLKFIRTSPLHGTAFDIAKDPKLADPSSFIAAIQLAIRCTLNQKNA